MVERLNADLLFRWFCGIDPASPIFDATVLAHNRPRLDAFGITAAFFHAVVQRAVSSGLTSDDRFNVDGTLIHIYTSIKSFKSNEEADRKDDSDDHNGLLAAHRGSEFSRPEALKCDASRHEQSRGATVSQR